MSGNNNSRREVTSKDEVDFVIKPSYRQQLQSDVYAKRNASVAVQDINQKSIALINTNNNSNTLNNNHNNLQNNNSTNNTNSNSLNNNNNSSSSVPSPKLNSAFLNKKRITGTLYGDCEVKTSIKSSLSTLEKLPIFKIQSKKKTETSSNPATVKERPKFVKSASIARLLGNTYSTKKSENEQMMLVGTRTTPNGLTQGAGHCFTVSNGITATNQAGIPTNVNLSGGYRPFNGTERFQKSSSSQHAENDINEMNLKDLTDDINDRVLSVRAFRTISRSLGKLLRRRTHSVDISTPDPEYKVSYLGNVLTGWAKGEGCVEKPLNTLWRNYTQNHKPDVIMRVNVCASGLKATTRQHGLTEYWAHRITHCSSPKNYPRVFCWIYRHEGRKLKHEMRCHAVLCSKESIAQEICSMLRENLDIALRDFKREKLSKQNARLSLANAAYENPSLPRRKILLSVGGNNYRPPMERSKSAPKLMAIEEAIGEEEGEETEQTNEPEMLSCCQKDSLYPAMTLGRRRCRRGHSIRRTGKGILKTDCFTRKLPECALSGSTKYARDTKDICEESTCCTTQSVASLTKAFTESNMTKSVTSLGSDEDDLEKVLIRHDYDSSSPLAGELLSYFDLAMKPKTSSLTNLDDVMIDFEPNVISADPKRRRSGARSLDNLDSFSDCGEDGADEADDDDEEYECDELFYQQSAILNLLHRTSMHGDLKVDDEKSQLLSNPLGLTQQQQHFDSDEGSISSGCETASTVTGNLDDASLKSIPQQTQPLDEENCSRGGTLTKNSTRSFEDDEDIKISSTTINFKLPHSGHGSIRRNASQCGSVRKSSGPNAADGDVSDSEFSDESGYVEFQEHNLMLRNKSVVV